MATIGIFLTISAGLFFYWLRCRFGSVIRGNGRAKSGQMTDLSADVSDNYFPILDRQARPTSATLSRTSR